MVPGSLKGEPGEEAALPGVLRPESLGTSRRGARLSRRYEDRLQRPAIQ